MLYIDTAYTSDYDYRTYLHIAVIRTRKHSGFFMPKI
nr:MAG TPA: hypothetical protein [Bacteriophage sp.]